MCGRFVQSTPAEALRDEFGLDPAAPLPDLTPCYNVAPTMEVATIRLLPGDDGPRLVQLRWGLVPFWADDLKIGARHINARSESAHTKPAFREAFVKRRCLVPADGFFEWETGPSGQKQPFLIRFATGRPLALAGLWEQWRSPEGTVVESVTVLTTRANDLVAKLHDRMPVILDEPARLLWLDPALSDVGKLRSLLKPFDSAPLDAFPVSPRVNKVANDDPGLIERVELAKKPSQLDLL